MFVGYFRGRIALVSTTRIVSMAGHDSGMMAQVAGELGGEEACNDALPRDALGQMLCARRTEVEERLRACAAASAGQQVGGPEAGGGGDEEQAADVGGRAEQHPTAARGGARRHRFEPRGDGRA